MEAVKDNFNYWDSEHYEVKSVSGTYDYCINAFKEECKSYPSRLFSTHVWSKSRDNDGTYNFLIRRFITEELFQIHASYPPNYVRNGHVL